MKNSKTKIYFSTHIKIVSGEVYSLENNINDHFGLKIYKLMIISVYETIPFYNLKKNWSLFMIWYQFDIQNI